MSVQGPANTAADIGATLSRLVSAQPTRTGWDVITPLLYPSGAAVIAHVSRQGDAATHADTFLVSDSGFGFSEAFAMDVSNAYSRAAKELAEQFGVTYDKRRLFLPQVSWDKAPAAIRLVANCAQSAVILASERASERKAMERSERLYVRLQRLFRNVTHNAELPGASSTAWTVDAMVKEGDRVVVFDAVTPHQNSVSSTATKFHDLALREDAPGRCATVESKRAMGTLLAVLSQAGAVIEDDAPDSTVRHMAEAA